MSGVVRTINDRIIVDPEIVAGKPVVKNTRIPVELVLKRLSQNLDIKLLFEAYPQLTLEDVKACVDYAHALVEGEDVFPAPAEPADLGGKRP